MNISSVVSRQTSRVTGYLATFDINLRRLLAVFLVETLAINAYVSVLMPYYKSLGFGSDVAGSLSSVLSIVSSIVAVAGGVLADRLGRRKLFLAGHVIRCLVVAILLTMGNFAGLIIVSILRGMSSIEFPARSAMFASYTSSRNRATVLGIQQTLGQLATVLGPIGAGVLADRLGVRVPFAVGGVLAVLSLIMSLQIQEKLFDRQDSTPSTSPSTPVEPETGRTVGATTAKLTVRLRCMFAGRKGLSLGLLLCATLANGIANAATGILLPFTVMDRFSSAYSAIAGLQSFAALGTMLVLILGGRLADLHGRRKIIMTSGILFPAFMTLVSMARSLWQMYLLVVGLTMLANVGSPATSAVFMEAVPDTDRATFMGFQIGVNSVGMALGSFLGGILYKTHPGLAWWMVILLFASQTLFYHLVLPKGKVSQEAI